MSGYQCQPENVNQKIEQNIRILSEKTFHETVIGVDHAITLSRSQIGIATILVYHAN